MSGAQSKRRLPGVQAEGQAALAHSPDDPADPKVIQVSAADGDDV